MNRFVLGRYVMVTVGALGLITPLSAQSQGVLSLEAVGDFPLGDGNWLFDMAEGHQSLLLPVAAAVASNPNAQDLPGTGDKTLDKFLESQKVPREQWPTVQKQLNKLWDILSGVGAALGGEKAIDFRVGQWWSTDLEKRVVYLPIQDILLHLKKPEVLVGGVSHEAGHVYLTRFHKLPRYQELLDSTSFPKIVHAFFNVLEDMYQEKAMGLRWPGLPHYLQQLHATYRPDILRPDLPLPAGLLGKQPNRTPTPEEVRQTKKLFPHEEYLEVLRHFWMTGKFPDPASLVNEKVRQAMKNTQDSIVRYMDLMPVEKNPSEQNRVRQAQERFKHIEDKILPTYLALLQITQERLQQKQQKGEGDKQQDRKEKGQGKGDKQQDRKEKGQGKDADKLIESRAEKIAKDYFPTHGKEGSPDKPQESAPLNPNQRGAASPTPGSTAKENLGRVQPSEVIIADLLRGHEAIMQSSRPKNKYEESLVNIYPFVDPFVGRLENLFTHNARPTWEGYFNYGQRVDIRKWMKSEAHGWREPDDYKVFQRRRDPTRRDYKFRLLIDLSGSMEGTNIDLALDAVVLFMEVLGRLEIDHSVLGFANKVYLFKDFSRDPLNPGKMTHEEKRSLVENIRSSVGGATYDTEAVLTSLQGDGGRNISALEDQAGEWRYLLVITDGEGNGAASGRMNETLERARKRQIGVVGIGVGEGMAYVSKRYPLHVLVPNMEALPEHVSNVLEELIRIGFDAGGSQ